MNGSGTRNAPYGFRVLANSIPKAGTHLLRKCLCLMPGLRDTGLHVDMSLSEDVLHERLAGVPSGGIVTAHLFHREGYARLLSDLGYRSVFILRDPRDVVVSRVWYVLQHPDHHLYEYFHNLYDDGARLMASIVGVPAKLVPWDDVGLRNINELYQAFLGWTREPSTCTVRFEDLVGPRGGGNRAAQLGVIETLAHHLDVPLTGADMDRIAERIFDPKSPTFRKGQIGEWKHYFSPLHKQYSKELQVHY